MTDANLVQVTQDQHVLTITLNRPDRRNALTLAMYQSMGDALAAASERADIRAVIIHANGEAFCAGNDLGDFLNRGAGDVSPAINFLHALRQCEKPVIAAVNGLAVGIGVTLLLHCDFVYLAQSARLRLPFTSLGVVPEAGSSLILPRMVGRHKAAELLMLGDFFSARAAIDMGLGNEQVADEQLLARAQQVAQQLAALPFRAIRETKRLLNKTADMDLKSRMDEEFALFATMLHEPDAREAMQAFLEKRPPRFNLGE